MSPKTKGRMINKGISNSKGFASLSPESATLFMMLIPHYSSYGKMNGGPGYIKDEICPLIPYLTYKNIPNLLKEISEKTNVKHFEIDGRWWIHSINFISKHQTLKPEKMGSDSLPSYSRVIPELVPHEGEVEVEDEVEDKGEGEGHSGVPPAPLPKIDLMTLWNQKAEGSNLIKAQGMSDKRLSHCKARLKERPLTEWESLFSRMAATPFLNGENDQNWRASFDWIISSKDNALKVLEGKYDKKNGKLAGASKNSTAALQMIEDIRRKKKAQE